MAGSRPRTSPERQPSRSAEGRTQLLLEEIRSQNRATIEAVQSFRVELTERVDDVKADLSGRLGAVESAVTNLSGRTTGLEAAVNNLAGRTTSLESSVDKLTMRTTGLESAVDRLTMRTTGLESAVDKLSGRATSVEATLERMDAKLDRKADTAVTDALEARVQSLEQRSGA